MNPAYDPRAPYDVILRDAVSASRRISTAPLSSTSPCPQCAYSVPSVLNPNLGGVINAGRERILVSRVKDGGSVLFLMTGH
jgi:hypothetical protein